VVEVAQITRSGKIVTREVELHALSPGPTTAESLLEAVVRAELRAFADRSDAASDHRPLTESEVLEALTTGTVSSSAPDQVDTTLLPSLPELLRTLAIAHKDGLFEMTVDDKRVAKLADEVDVQQRTRLLFVRMVGLSAGRLDDI